MNEDEEYAIKYAEERRMRMTLETRLHALMFEIIPYVSAATQMCEAFVKKDSHKIAEALAKLTQWHGDVETSILINMFKPRGTAMDVLVEADYLGCNCLEDLPPHKRKTLEEISRAASKSVQEEWDQFAAEHEFASVAEFNQNHREEMTKMVLEEMAKLKVQK